MEQHHDVDVPFELIADVWRNGGVVPFIGSAASFVGAPTDARLPDGRMLANELARINKYPGEPSDPLTKVAQYVQDKSGDRDWLLTKVAQWFDQDLECGKLANPYVCALTVFLEAVAASLPPLIITTNYDTVIERALERLAVATPDVRYVAFSHVMPGSGCSTQKLLYYTRLADEPQFLVKDKVDQRFRNGDFKDHIIIYKMHGTSRFSGAPSRADSIVMTEGDYINFLASDQLNRVPNAIMKVLRSARFLFLGYALEDWNFRVLLQRLRSFQGSGQRHWACRIIDETKPDGRIERSFWDKRNVELYNTDLGGFLTGLAAEITRLK